MSLRLLNPFLAHLGFSEPRAKHYSQGALGTLETPAQTGSVLYPSSAEFLQEHIWAQALGRSLGLFFTTQLQCPVLFLGTPSFPSDTGAQVSQ